MKKVTVLLLLLAMLMNVSALADELTIHSGVTFGMSVSEVEAVEKANGFTPESFNIDALFGRNPNAIPNETTVTGTIAGIADSKINYYFHNNKLFCAQYHLGKTHKAWDTAEMDIERMKMDYESISDSLSAKYGNTDYTWLTSKKYDLPGEYHDQTVSCFGAQEWVIANPIMESTVSIERYEQWLIPQSDGSAIQIDHSLYFYNNEFYHRIYYTHFSSDIIQASSTKEQQRNSDL